ncbi:hypothetical protein MKI85_10555 [Acinetobacter sp. A7.4]|nr:hypothetical protein [Acinetobacter sp. A7.4]
MQSDRLIIEVKDSDDSLLIEHYFYTFYQYSRPVGKQHIEFENGTIWYQDDIKRELHTPTEQDDTLKGFYDEQNILYGLNGNDLIYGANKSDQLFGGNGNDELYGDSGNDTLVGGMGFDELYGGSGSDTYIFSRGDGRDSLDDKRSSSSTILYYLNGQPVYAPEDDTTLIFTDAKFADLEFVRKDYGGAEIFIAGTNDSVYIPKFFESSGRYQINKIFLQQENLELSLADYLDEFNKPTNRDDIININNQGSSTSLDLLLGNDYITLIDSSNMSIYGGQGNDRFSLSNSSNITVYGGIDDDSLRVYGGGVNTLNGGEGHDHYTIEGVSGTQIYDADFSGTIYLDTNAVYFRWSEDGYWLDSRPTGSLIEEYPNGNQDYAYDSNSRRLVNVEYNAVDATLKVDKQGVSWKSSFANFSEGFTYFELKDLRTSDQLQLLLQNMKVHIDGESFRYSSTGKVVNFKITTLSFADFLNQGTVTQRYGDTDSNIIGLTENKTNYSDIDGILYQAGDMIYSGSGNDTINVGLGSSLVHAGAGNDNIVAPDSSALNFIYAEDGDDIVHIAKGNAYGGAGNDTLIGSQLGDLLDGGIGVDYLQGNGGDDNYYVDNIADQVIEDIDQGFDCVNSSVTYTLMANVEKLVLIGTAHINGTGNSLDNILIGNGANNNLYGGAGDDTFYSGGGSKVQMVGGLGNDIYYMESGVTITENSNEGIDIVYSSTSYTLGVNIENLVLTGSAATGKGNTLDNRIIGNYINNTLTGGDGNDYLDGGTGSDKLQGGTGNDIYIVDNIGDSITERSGEGMDTVQSSVSFELGNYVENLTLLESENINATGNSLSNVLIGNSGQNVLNGGAGDDQLNGKEGNDQLIGGTGSDTAIYSLLVQADNLGGNGADSWSDFMVGNTLTNVNADKINISELLVNYTGDQSVASLSPYINTILNGTNTQIYFDRDGGGATFNSDLLLTLNNVNVSLDDLVNNKQIIV